MNPKSADVRTFPNQEIGRDEETSGNDAEIETAVLRTTEDDDNKSQGRRRSNAKLEILDHHRCYRCKPLFRCSPWLGVITMIVLQLFRNTLEDRTSPDVVVVREKNNNNITASLHHRPNLMYGHVHMAKTGGSSVNGILANKFERVCGNKGYR